MPKHNNIANFELLLVVFFFMISNVDAENEKDKILSRIETKYSEINEGGVRESLIAELNLKHPRIIELSRRIDCGLGAWGDFPDFRKTMYQQIDGVLESEPRNDGRWVARVVLFLGNDAVAIYCWNYHKLADNKSVKMVSWIRKFPQSKTSIDIVSPERKWNTSTVSLENFDLARFSFLEKSCNDSMPPSEISPVVLSHLAQEESVIVEIVKPFQDKMVYEWAIRSSIYTTGYKEFMSDFEKLVNIK